MFARNKYIFIINDFLLLFIVKNILKKKTK